MIPLKLKHHNIWVHFLLFNIPKRKFSTVTFKLKDCHFHNCTKTPRQWKCQSVLLWTSVSVFELKDVCKFRLIISSILWMTDVLILHQFCCLIVYDTYTVQMKKIQTIESDIKSRNCYSLWVKKTILIIFKHLGGQFCIVTWFSSHH